MSAPADYDSASIKVDPQTLWALATKVENSRQALLAHVNTIFGALAALSTGWNSDSAHEAQAFAQQLGAACDDVFGSDGSDGVTTASGPLIGVLNQYMTYLKAAADGFDSTEAQLKKQWQDYNTGLSGAAPSSPPAGNGAINDPKQTAVSYDTVGR